MSERPLSVVLPWWVRRLGPLLVGMTMYLAATAFIVQWFTLPKFDLAVQGALAETFVLAILMSFRNRAAYDRWWEGRRLWGQLVNDTRNLAWKLRGFLPADVLARSRLPAAMAGFAEALKRHLRGAVRLQEIPGFEHEAEAPSHVPSYLAGLVLTRLAAWSREGLLDAGAVLVLDVHARGLLDVCGACERIRNTNISRSYKMLIRLGVLVNLLAAPWMIAPEMGFWAVPALVFLFGPILAVELLDSVVEEPFGTDPDDLDLDRYCAVIGQSVTSILGESGKGTK